MFTRYILISHRIPVTRLIFSVFTLYPHSSITSSLAISTGDSGLSMMPAQSSYVTPRLPGNLLLSTPRPPSALVTNSTQFIYTAEIGLCTNKKECTKNQCKIRFLFSFSYPLRWNNSTVPLRNIPFL